jgi:hypothetical protein
MLVDPKALNGAQAADRELYAGGLSSVYLRSPRTARSGSRSRCCATSRREGGRLFDRFLQEYEVIARVRHPNVVRIFDLA